MVWGEVTTNVIIEWMDGWMDECHNVFGHVNVNTCP